MPTFYTVEHGRRAREDVERSVRDANDELQDDRAGSVSEHDGWVTWRLSGTSHGAWSDDPPPDRLEAPQVVKTSWRERNQGARVRCYRRFDGEWVAVDCFDSLPGDLQGVRDYALANYDTLPFVETLSPALPAFDEEGRVPWSERTPPTDPDSETGRRIVSLLRSDERDVLDLDELAPLLVEDEYLHLLGTRLPAALELDGTTVERILDWLEDDDPEVRARAVRLLDALTSDASDADRHPLARRSGASLPESGERDAFVAFVRAIPTVDEATQRLVARSLWEPWVVREDAPPAEAHVEALADLLDADLPEVRVGALQGAGRAFGEIVAAVLDGEHDVDSVSDLERAIPAFYDAYEAALGDDHPIVRGRAAELGGAPLCGRWREEAVVPTREFVFHELPFERRWRIACAEAALSEDEVEAVAERASRAGSFGPAMDDSPEALATAVEYAWTERGPRWEYVRVRLAQRAADDPEPLAEHVDAPVGAVRDGTPTEPDLDLLTELVPVAPDRVASVAGELEALLGRDDELAPAAARTLHALEYERPTAVTVSHGTIVDALDDVRDELDRVRPERVRDLAAADADRAADVLRDAAREAREDDSSVGPGNYARALDEVARVAPGAVAAAAEDVCASLPALTRHTLEGYVGLARAALARPAAFAPHADAVLDALAVERPLAREALATALVAIGEHDRSALPEVARGVLSHADAAYDPDRIEALDEEHGHEYERDGAGPLDELPDSLLGQE